MLAGGTSFPEWDIVSKPFDLNELTVRKDRIVNNSQVTKPVIQGSGRVLDSLDSRSSLQGILARR